CWWTRARTGSTTWTTTACSPTRSSATRSASTGCSRPASSRSCATRLGGPCRRAPDQHRHADAVVVGGAALAPDVGAGRLAADQEHAEVERLAGAARAGLGQRLEPALRDPTPGARMLE